MAEVLGNAKGKTGSSLKLVWTWTAIRDLTGIRNYIGQDNLPAAVKLASRILEASELLVTRPEMGREGRALPTRELVIAGTNYRIVYRIRKNKLELLRVLHGKQLWPQLGDGKR